MYLALMALIPNRSPGIAANILIGILALVTILATLSACYRFPVRWCSWIYRAVMRRLAKRTIRASWSQAMNPVKCLGIMERNDGVALRIDYGELDNARIGLLFDVYDSVNGERWGRVEVVEVSQKTSLCVPTDVVSEEINREFWEHLESRMRYDTSAPKVYLTLALPTDLRELVESILENWR